MGDVMTTNELRLTRLSRAHVGLLLAREAINITLYALVNTDDEKRLLELSNELDAMANRVIKELHGEAIE